jgi:DNA polymerase III subunit alpha
MTRRGRMMVVMLDDGTAQVEISVFNELFEKHRDKLKEDALLVVSGKVQNDEFSGGLRVMAEDLLDLAALRTRFASLLRLSMNGQADAVRLKQVLAPYRANGDGSCRVLIQYENETATCEVALGDAWRVRPDHQLLADLTAWLTPDNVQVLYAA